MAHASGDRRIALRIVAQDLRIGIAHELLRRARHDGLGIERLRARHGDGVGRRDERLERRRGRRGQPEHQDINRAAHAP